MASCPGQELPGVRGQGSCTPWGLMPTLGPRMASGPTQPPACSHLHGVIAGGGQWHLLAGPCRTSQGLRVPERLQSRAPRGRGRNWGPGCTDKPRPGPPPGAGIWIPVALQARPTSASGQVSAAAWCVEAAGAQALSPPSTRGPSLVPPRLPAGVHGHREETGVSEHVHD